jgi:lysozyme
LQIKTKTTIRTKRKGFSLKLKVMIVAIFLLLLSPFYYGYVLNFATSVLFRWRYPDGNRNYPNYKSFSIRIPKKYTVHGIDVSYYQGKINWAKVKEMEEDDVKISFAFIKATEGLFLVDPYFKRNWRLASKAGLKVGAYHFFRPKRSGLLQAKLFLQTVSLESGDLPPVVDIESLDGVTPAKMRKELNAFINKIERKTKVKPIIYTGLKFYRRYLEDDYQDYPFWIANYHQPKLRLENKNWVFWQHSDKASVNGIGHKVDFNVFNGDSVAFSKVLIP